MGQISAMLTMRCCRPKKKIIIIQKIKTKVGKADAPPLTTAHYYFFPYFRFAFLLICLISATYIQIYVCIDGGPSAGWFFTRFNWVYVFIFIVFLFGNFSGPLLDCFVFCFIPFGPFLFLSRFGPSTSLWHSLRAPSWMDWIGVGTGWIGGVRTAVEQ